MAAIADAVAGPVKSPTNIQIAWLMFAAALLFAAAKPILPDGLIRLPEWALLPWQEWMQSLFDFIREDIGLIYVTRGIASGLEVLLDATGNILYGKHRWPRIGPAPWAAVAGVLGYWLGGWRLALLAGGTFVWTAVVGQWKLAMETMSVIVVAAPTAFLAGLGLGILAWKHRSVEKALRPMLAVLQTLPFFTYLLPAVIFFKVGPTAAATIVFAVPPMVLMATLGLKKVSPEVVEAGKMSSSTRWQMLRHVYLPSARTEILVGVNQVIMLCLAMVVLTEFISMPGLGAKLLAMMNSFKLGRSFEIGVTIVLIAVTLDRLSKAWAVRQPEHFEKGTPWRRRHIFLLTGIGVFVVLTLLTLVEPYLFKVGRRQDLSMGREIDDAIKWALDVDWVQSATESIRWFLNTKVLIPFRDSVLWPPVPAVLLAFGALAYGVGGRRSCVTVLIFFGVVAVTG